MATKEKGDLDSALKEFASFLVRLAKWKNPTEIEFEMRVMQDRLSEYGKSVQSSEQQTVIWMQSLVEAHAKNTLIERGYDPFSMQPIVKLEGDELSF